MGILRPTPPKWAPAAPWPWIKDAVTSAVQLSKEWDASGAGLPELALQYAVARAREVGMPTVVGLSTPEEVHASAKVWHEVDGEGLAATEEWIDRVKRMQDLFRDAQVLDCSWASP
jgi:D-arabinose 1-dehydrogenase